ncbi:hypothetical protein [Tenacibaculum sp.]|uniref:hypothetical protein n=1 Tax=Tenacibaculum sp. TaxID=1906242 RepID=UPI003D0A0113
MNKKNTWLRIIVKTIIVTAILFIGSNVYDNLNSKENEESYLEKKLTIEQMENSEPTRFLEVSGNYKKSFWGTKINVHGKIINRATVATYKDAVIRVIYYSKTETVLGRKNYVIYELFPPNSTKSFELKIENYRDVNSIGLNIVNASNKQ